MTLYAVMIPMETPTETSTETSPESPSESTAEAPAESTAEEVTVPAQSGGCGSVIGLAILPCLTVGAYFIRKKRED
jgi:hypothetical protein